MSVKCTLAGPTEPLLENLPVERRPVGHAAKKAPDVDHVEAVGLERPWRTAVVYLEPAVRGDELGLYRGDVDARHFRRRVLVRKVSVAGINTAVLSTGLGCSGVHGPDASARPNVEHSLRVVADGRQIELVVEKQPEHVVPAGKRQTAVALPHAACVQTQCQAGRSAVRRWDPWRPKSASARGTRRASRGEFCRRTSIRPPGTGHTAGRVRSGASISTRRCSWCHSGHRRRRQSRRSRGRRPARDERLHPRFLGARVLGRHTTGIWKVASLP